MKKILVHLVGLIEVESVDRVAGEDRRGSELIVVE